MEEGGEEVDEEGGGYEGVEDWFGVVGEGANRIFDADVRGLEIGRSHCSGSSWRGGTPKKKFETFGERYVEEQGLRRIKTY